MFSISNVRRITSFYYNSLFLTFIIIMYPFDPLTFTCPYHIADIEHLSLRYSHIPTSRCMGFPLALDNVPALFCVVCCHHYEFFFQCCWSKGVFFLIRQRCLIASACRSPHSTCAAWTEATTPCTEAETAHIVHEHHA